MNLDKNEDLSDSKAVLNKLNPLFEKYRQEYKEYYETCKHSNSPAMRDPNPVIIIYPGVECSVFQKISRQPVLQANFMSMQST